MEFQRSLCLFLVLLSLSTLISISEGHKYYVGGSDQGWTPNPSENYNQWSGRNRFQVNDTVVFKYKKGSDSVLEVNKEDYEKCNKTKPLKKFEEGDTEVKLDRPGPFYFISGEDGNCEKGQKLVVVVITPRTTQTPKSSPSPSPSPPVSPSPPGNPPSPASSPAPSGGSPAPAASSPSPSPSPISTPPAGGPTTTTSPTPAATSPSPTSTAPAGGPTTSTAPAGGPSTSTAPAGGPSISTSPTGGPPAPGTPPTSSLAPGSANSPASSNTTAAPPNGNSGSSITPSSFLVLSVTVVGAGFLRYGAILG